MLQRILRSLYWKIPYRVKHWLRVLTRDPNLRPGRRALNHAVMMAGPLGSLVRALEAGGYSAAPSKLVQGSELKLESIEAVMGNVTFTETHIKLPPMYTPAERREQIIRGG
jgi:hypothetical protein